MYFGCISHVQINAVCYKEIDGFTLKRSGGMRKCQSLTEGRPLVPVHVIFDRSQPDQQQSVWVPTFLKDIIGNAAF
jgi:hypothetical protein